MTDMGQWQTQLCALIVLAVFLLHGQVTCRICDPSNRTGPVFFTEELNVAEYINYGASKPLLCCATGFNTIQWYILNASDLWGPYPPDSSGTDAPQTEEDGQVLRIYHAVESQNTKFRCDLLVNGTAVMNHTVRLHVSHCSTVPRGPLLIEPFPQNQTIYDYGGNVNLYCTGDFGCYKHNDVRLVLWSVDTIQQKNASEVSPRYHLVTTDSEDKTTLGLTLTIENVQPEDTTRMFMCTIFNDQMVSGLTSRMVWITKEERPKPPTMKIVIAVSIVAGIFLTAFLLGLCMYKCYGPQVQLFFYMHCPCCRRKAMDEEKYQYHVFLYHADVDIVKAEYIKSNLMERNYVVFISYDIKPGTNYINATSKFFEQSAAVHFLYTENLLHDLWALRFLTMLMDEGKDILCLEINDFEPKDIITAIEEVQAGNGGPLLEASTEGLDVDGENVDRNETVSVSKDIGFWKRLPKVKVPTENDSKRKQENFWCSLQNKLPKPRPQNMETSKTKRSLKCQETNERNSSSEKPLLDTPPATPMGYIGPQQEFSPNSDNAFEYPEQHAHNANISCALNAETYLHNDEQHTNQQPVTLSEPINQVRGQSSVNNVTILPGFQEVLERRGEQVTLAADIHQDDNVFQDSFVVNRKQNSYDNGFHGVSANVMTVGLSCPISERSFMSSGSESPPTSASVSSPSDCNDDFFKSGSYSISSVGGNSGGVSVKSDSGYGRSQTGSSFGADGSVSGASQSVSASSPDSNGFPSGELSSFSDSGEVKNDGHTFVKVIQGVNDGLKTDNKALKLTIGPTVQSHSINNNGVTPESGYSSVNTKSFPLRNHDELGFQMNADAFRGISEEETVEV